MQACKNEIVVTTVRLNPRLIPWKITKLAVYLSLTAGSGSPTGGDIRKLGFYHKSPPRDGSLLEKHPSALIIYTLLLGLMYTLS